MWHISPNLHNYYIFKVFPIDTLFSVLNNPQFHFHIYCALCEMVFFFCFYYQYILRIRKQFYCEMEKRCDCWIPVVLRFLSFDCVYIGFCIYICAILNCLKIRKAYKFVYWKTRVFVNRAYTKIRTKLGDISESHNGIGLTLL